ncbi:MAG: trypsin-like peptidase domain-containing protein [Magnetococcales bacterium]|nr:trypsin-like peptidase domain-containing protein [Magnetococcales bacterium]
MSPKDKLYCGKDLRKYLYLVGIVALFILIGSYWYTQYYLKGVGLNATITGESPPLLPVAASAAPAQGVPAALWGGAPQPQVQTVAAVSAVPKGGFSQITRRLMPSVVNVSATRAPGGAGAAAPAAQAGGAAAAATPPPPATADNGLRFAQPFSGASFESIGSGIVVTADGYVLTNHHVVEQSQEVYVTVFEKNGSTMRYHAEVVSLNAKRELALLKVDPMRPLKPAPLGNSKQAMIGDPVIAIGSPFGLDQTVSQGIISGKRNAITIEGIVHKDLLQTDAAINRGNSGGPLVDGKGMVIGVNTAIYTTTGAFAGIGFAVPIERAREFIEEVVPLPAAKAVPAAAMGVAQGGAPPIYANAVMPHEDRGPCDSCHTILQPPLAGNAAAGSGMTPVAAQMPTAPPIAANAVMPHEDRGPCTSCHQILPATPTPGAANAANGAMAAFRPGYQGRGGMNYSFSPGGAVGIPAAMPAQPPGAVGAANGGLDVVALEPTMARQLRSPYPDGVWVRSVMPGSFGMQAGLRANDILFKLNGRWLKSPQDLSDMLAGLRPGQSVRFAVIREGERLSLSATINAAGGVEGATGVQPVAMVVPQTATDPMMTQALPMPGEKGQQPFAGATANAPAAAAPPVKTEFEWMGLELNPITAAMKQKDPSLLNKFGAVVADLDPGTAAELAGIQVGDIVVAINNQMVPSAAALDQAITAAGKQQTILLEVERNNSRMFATLQ